MRDICNQDLFLFYDVYRVYMATDSAAQRAGEPPLGVAALCRRGLAGGLARAQRRGGLFSHRTLIQITRSNLAKMYAGYLQLINLLFLRYISCIYTH